ncbi:MAG: hypothetical protein Q9227_001969 [Pyrenula ochraceoflavens]
MASAALIGATGMVVCVLDVIRDFNRLILGQGSQILSHLCSSPPYTQITFLARRNHPAVFSHEEKVKAFIEADTSKWASQIKDLRPPPDIFFSAFATTRAAAGGFDKQYQVEHDLHLELAKAAKEAGIKVYVLISAQGANKQAMFGYPKMKGEIEEGIKAIGFDHTVIIRPGLIAGTREESRPAEAAIRKIAAAAGHVNAGLLKDFWAQDADEIGQAAVKAGLQALQGQAADKDWLIAGKDIVRLARTDLKE